jgi:hypothetical protein
MYPSLLVAAGDHVGKQSCFLCALLQLHLRPVDDSRVGSGACNRIVAARLRLRLLLLLVTMITGASKTGLSSTLQHAIRSCICDG